MRTYPFSQQESQQAFDVWGANCGPNALAFALGVPLENVRNHIPGFEEKRYTSPSMMKAALANLSMRWSDCYPQKEEMFGMAISLVRVQWTGPWTKLGANPKWAYRQTHWIAAWNSEDEHPFGDPMIFDCNSGIVPFSDWQSDIIPAIILSYPRADGGWFPTHIWRIMEAERTTEER
jgi:hypothetical protein